MDPEYSLQDVVRCDLCDSPVPKLHCEFCHTNLCKGCEQEHIQDNSINHKVVSFKQRNQSSDYLACQTGVSTEYTHKSNKTKPPFCVPPDELKRNEEHIVDMSGTLEYQKEFSPCNTNKKDITFSEYRKIDVAGQKADQSELNAESIQQNICQDEKTKPGPLFTYEESIANGLCFICYNIMKGALIACVIGLILLILQGILRAIS